MMMAKSLLKSLLRRSVAVLGLILISPPIHAQTYSQMMWGINKSVNPYQFGININGNWYNLGTITSAGAWTFSPAYYNPNSLIVATTSTFNGISTFNASTVYNGSSSGYVTVAPQANAGVPTLTFPTTTGTFAVAASSPLLLNTTTGNLTCATCATTTNGGALSASSPVALSSGGSISITGAAGQVLAGATPAFTATPTLGASGTLGSLTMGNATSGTVTLQPVTGALGTVTASLPANTGTIAETNLAQTWTANQTHNNSTILLLGSSTGYTTFTSANASGTNYTATIPANTGTIGELNLAQTWSATQTFSSGISVVNLAISATAPTATSVGGCGTTPSVTSNGTAAFQVTIGTVPTAAACVITMPTATTGWACSISDITTQSTSVFLQKQIASTTTSISVANYSTAGTLTAFTAADKLNLNCHAF